ncbi:DUF5977 domain-containing protein [Chryseobacterium zhengzhouense]|uniref:DUF5977 domain-containing protein n=1 Tax=Chryseobacterium zhengzhouense TaxID=1636086 RepID=A0ABW2LY68_9FLAO
MGSDPNNHYEGEPDEFSFNAIGLSGKFIIGNDGNVLVQSDDPNVKVDLSQMATYGGQNFCEPPVSIITITDGKGNKYIFGGDFSKYELSYSYDIQPSYPNEAYYGYPVINTFSLSKIIFADKKEVIFDYEQGTFSPYSFCNLGNWTNLLENSKVFSMDSFTQDGGRSDSWEDCYNGCDTYSNVLNSPSNKTTFSLLKKSVLKSIKYEDEEIRFKYIDAGYPIMHYTLSPFYANRAFNEWIIGSIETYYKNFLIKKQEFSYDHLGGTFKRPFLKSIVNVDSDENYLFEYHKTDNLPAYYTKGLDHWGYWNGKDTNTSLSPFDTATPNGDYTLEDTFRDPNPEKCDVALLKKITYPTRGFSIFEYEPHTYSERVERVAENQFLPALRANFGIVGGARIKKIFTYTETGQSSSKKEYDYANYGILMTWPRYFYHIQMYSQGLFRELLLRTSSNVQVNSFDSYNVGYKAVTEIEEGKGKILYSFTNYETHPDIFDQDPYNITQSTNGFTNIVPIALYRNLKNLYGIDNSALRGRNFGENYFSEDDPNNAYKKVFYEYYDNMEFNANSNLDNNNYVSVNHSSGVWTQAYRKYMNSARLKYSLTQEYINNVIPFNTQTDYFYDASNHLNVTVEKTDLYDGNIYETKYKYARDFGTSGDLNAENFTSIPIETTKYKNNEPLSKSKLNFSKSWTGHNILLPSSQQSVNDIAKINTPNEVYEDDIVYGQYDNKGNLLEYTTKNGTPTTIIYGYNRTLPIAKIQGVNYNSLMNEMGLSGSLGNYELLEICQKSNDDSYLALGSDETALITALDNFRKLMHNYEVTTYTYDPSVGVRSITLPNGIRETYNYDSASRLKKVTNMEGKILKEYKYNFGSQRFFNAEVSGTFRNLTCPSNTVGSPVTYTVPPNKYYSVNGQGEADNLAYYDMLQNGQALANTNSTCIPFTCPITFNSSLGITGSATLTADNAHGYYVITITFNTGPNSSTFDWDLDPGIKVATIEGGCRPSFEMYGYDSNGDGNYTIISNGEIYIDTGNAMPNNTTKTFHLILPFNS